ncbi:MAG: hypothetical protein WBA97_32620 [Actinophytocola sp.]|uniref:hypothetical protein n=1 Tax=Actinophytocola sp. TaxID=1872138 RepID=UPI003C77467B
MPLADDRVYGLKGIISLVRHFMARIERDGALYSDDLPVIVIEGFRGSGKSAVLSKLDGMLDQVPHARLDLETNRHASVPEVLSAIAFDLSRKYPKYALRFPRFIIGQLVMRLDLDLTDHSVACRAVENAWERYRNLDTVREVLADTAGSVLASMGTSVGLPIEPPGSLVRYAVTWLTKRAPAKHVTLGDYCNWYGHRDLGLRKDPIDVLVDLNRWATDPGDDYSRQRIDELLWSAFLADLRAEFDVGRRAGERSLNCVVLLDNADSPLGRRFLTQLVHARRERVVGEPGGADPLTVVTTSRGALLAEVPDADQVQVAPEELRTGPARPDWSRYWWVGYRLPDLTEDEVGRAIADMGLLLGKHQRMTRIVYDLTGGHPASTSLVLEAIAMDAPSKWVEPEAILARTERRGQQVPTVAARMLDRLLEGTSEAALQALVTCAPARRREQALALAGQEHLLGHGLAAYEETIDPLLWPAEESAGLMVLRRLLTRRLAERTGTDGPVWSEVHARLRHICRAEDDEAGDLYHALADDEVAFVATRLHQRLTELTCPDWHRLVTSVAGAPRRHRTGGAPVDEVRALVAAADVAPELVPVARLLAALHVTTDPFTDSRRGDVHLQIADDWANVGRLRPSGPHARFLEAARHHRREAEWWD